VASLIALLTENIFAGVTGNLAWEIVKKAWEKATEKSWDELFVQAFKAAAKEEKSRLKKYAIDGDVSLDSTQLSQALHQEITVAKGVTLYSSLNTDEFIKALAAAMVKHDVLTIGGHTLSEEDYTQLMRNVVKKTTSLFKDSILTHEGAFRRAVLDEALNNHEILQDIQQYLHKQFALTFEFLERLLDSISKLRRTSCWIVDDKFIEDAKQEATDGQPSMYERLGLVTRRHIVAEQDVRRRPTDTLMAAIKAIRGATGMRFQLVLAKGGNGKSTFLLRLAYELAVAGEYVLMTRSGESPDEDTLRQLCDEVKGSTSNPERRVCLLINDAYREHTPLLQNLEQATISNLTIVATSRYDEARKDSPRPGKPLLSGDAKLSNLLPWEAKDLISKIAACGALRATNAQGVVELNITDKETLLVTVALLTGADLDTYVLNRLIEINDQQDPTSMEPHTWTVFLQLYYRIALCHAWGVPVPQSLLPALSGLRRRQVDRLLCYASTNSVKEQALEHLQGTCEGLWGTDHELIATSAVDQLSDPDEDALSRFLQLLEKLAQVVDIDNGQVRENAAALAARLFRRCAETPALVFPTKGSPSRLQMLPPIRNDFIVADEPPTPTHVKLAEALDSSSINSSVIVLRGASGTEDLAEFFLPAYILLCKWRDAEVTAQSVLKNTAIVPHSRANIYIALGMIYEHMRRFDDAISSYDEALELDKENPDALAYKGHALYQIERYEEALLQIEASLKLRADHAETLTDAGYVLYRLKRYEEALPVLNRSLELHPDMLASLNNRGLVFRATEEYEAAFRDFNRVLELNPDYWVTLGNRGRTYHDRGTQSSTIGHKEQASEDFKASLSDLNRSLELHSEDADALTSRGTTYIALGQLANALADYDRSLQIRPDDPATLNNRGHTYSKLEQYEKALKDFNRSLELRPKHAHTLASRGEMYLSMKKYQEAVDDFSLALQLLAAEPVTGANRHLPTAIAANRAFAYYDLEEYALAINDYTQALAVSPDEIACLANCGLAYTHMQLFNDAEIDLARMKELEPNEPATFYTMACYHSLRGNLDEALRNLAYAIEGNDKYREMAQNDEDFANIREYEDFRRLVGIS
jgi:tetratricopeptide (TPR) repeat protein